MAAEKIEGTTKLMRLEVMSGEERRQIVAGIATKYTPESLNNLLVVAVVNLKPAKLRGVESQGMLLAAGGKDVLALVTLTEDVEPGTVVR